MLESIRIGQIRSYFETQQLSFALPNGARGSGYNVLVGKNNTGKGDEDEQGIAFQISWSRPEED